MAPPDYKPDPDHLTTEKTINQSLLHYFMYGLEPGSFCHALILGDFHLAYQRAHVHLKIHEDRNKGSYPITDLLYLVSHLPEECHGSNEKYLAWINHGGLDGADNRIKVKIKLAWNESVLGKCPI